MSWLTPKAETSLKITPGTPVTHVFGCAEQRLQELRGNRNSYSFWDTKITARDEANGLLESGNYHEDNIVGFQIHLHYQPEYGTINLRMKGGGPHFMDLGVDNAMKDFKEGLQNCLDAHN